MATECSHFPSAAWGPHTVCMKSAVTASKRSESQFVAGWVAVQTGGSSSITTTRGYTYLVTVRVKLLSDDVSEYCTCQHKG